MALELYYTSSPRGLRPGTSGLCTVAMSRSMSAALAARLESLCGYRPPSESASMEQWPAALSHWIVEVGGVERHVLASVRPVRPDHTMRTNTLAHFAVLHNSELDASGAAWMLAQPETSAVVWSGEPQLLDAERAMPRGGPSAPRVCSTWQSVTGDAGWAGVLANAAMLDPAKSVSVIYPAGAPVLDLVSEAMALLPVAYRWRVTFTTYFMQPIAGLRCTWRFCLDGTSAATAARQGGGAVIDACVQGPCPRTGAFIDAARMGREPALAPAHEAASAQHRRSAQLQQARGAAEPISIEREQASIAPARIPVRRPVGMDEPAPTHAGQRRDMFAAAVVAGVVLLAIVAVLAVLLRMTSMRVSELEMRLAAGQDLAAELSAAQSEVAALQEDRDRLQRDLGQVSSELSAVRRQLSEAEGRIRTTPSDDGSSSPEGAGGTRERERSNDSAGVAPGSGPAQVRLDLRGGRSSSERASAQAEPADALAEFPRPSLGLLADQPVRLDWLQGTGCAATGVSIEPSAALRACGFDARDGETLVFRSGERTIDVARVSVDRDVVTWTWLREAPIHIDRALKSDGMKLPGAWSAILGQVQLTAMCAGEAARHAFGAAPHEQSWGSAGPGSNVLTVSIPRALAQRPSIEWCGSVSEIARDSASAMSLTADAGTVSVTRSEWSRPDGLVSLTLEWIPPDSDESVAKCIGDLEAAIAQERQVNALYSKVDAWVRSFEEGMPRQSRLEADAQREFEQWREGHIKQLGARDQVDRFNALPLASQASEFRAWLWRSRLKPMQDDLVTGTRECEQLMAKLNRAMAGAAAIIRPEPGSPALMRVSPQTTRRVPKLAFASDRWTPGSDQ